MRAGGDVRRGARLDLAVLLVASSGTIWCYLHAHAALGPALAPGLNDFQGSHRIPLAGYGWWSWWDQSEYIQATLAWAQGVLDPAYHSYLPGYPLLGAAFVRLMPAQPFMLPDLACLVGSLWLFAALAARLLGGVRGGRAIGAGVFVATTVLPQKALWSWVVPWTTTPEALCVFGCLLAAARFVEGGRARDAFLAALAGIAVAGFRPADAAIVTGVSGVVMGATLLRYWPGWRRALRIAGAALAGAAVPALVFGGAYLAVFGMRTSDYLVLSSALGFEWRLLPLRWVMLMIDPKPVFPEGRGLAAVFPWIAPGVAGMAACLAAPGGVPRRVHGLVIGATALDCAMFLAFRDLHPTGLWRFGNFHYFKWMLPIFGLYAVLLVRGVALTSRLPALAAAVCAILGLFMWRVEIADPVKLPRPSSVQEAVLPSGLSRIDDVVLAKGSGDRSALYGGESEIRAGEMTFRSFYDFKIFPSAGRLMVLPLRSMPAVASTLHLATGTMLDVTVAPILARQVLAWGLPCWVMRERAGCQTRFLLPPTILPLDDLIIFGSAGRADDYLAAGWSDAEALGRWTDGRHASLRFEVPRGRADDDLVVEITAYGYVPDRAGPMRVTVVANKEAVATWLFGPAPAQSVRAVIPRRAVAPGDAVLLDLVIAKPRRPSARTASDDARELGIYVEATKLTAVPRSR